MGPHEATTGARLNIFARAWVTMSRSSVALYPYTYSSLAAELQRTAGYSAGVRPPPFALPPNLRPHREKS